MRELKKAIEDFYENTISESQNNLRRLGKDASGNLSKSMTYDIKEFPSGFSSSMSMADYGDFVDKGVKGVGGTKADGSRWKLKKVTSSPYKYRSKKPPIAALDRWTVRRGIAPRGKGGKFKQRDSVKFAIANTIFHEGLETTYFFSAPLDRNLAKLPGELIEAYGKDIENYFKENINLQ